MIENFESGARKVVLGEGTTYISQLLVNGDTLSSGICFSTKPPIEESDFKFKGDEVIIEITNFQGAMSYLKSGIELLKTWEIEGLDKQFAELSRSLEVLTRK